jgi:hypothetical protein
MGSSSEVARTMANGTALRPLPRNTSLPSRHRTASDLLGRVRSSPTRQGSPGRSIGLTREARQLLRRAGTSGAAERRPAEAPKRLATTGWPVPVSPSGSSSSLDVPAARHSVRNMRYRLRSQTTFSEGAADQIPPLRGKRAAPQQAIDHRTPGCRPEAVAPGNHQRTQSVVTRNGE